MRMSPLGTDLFYIPPFGPKRISRNTGARFSPKGWGTRDYSGGQNRAESLGHPPFVFSGPPSMPITSELFRYRSYKGFFGKRPPRVGAAAQAWSLALLPGF